MPITLNDFANGDTDYVTKHNGNNSAIVAALSAMESQLSGGLGAAISVGEALKGLFGPVTAVIGAESYACTGASSTLTVQAGYAWNAGTGLVTRLVGATPVLFTGLPAATYYISASPTGGPQRSTSALNALYSVVWTGSAFGAITRVAPIVWGASDWTAAQASAAHGQAFDTLDARLEFTEAQIGSAGLARTYQSTRTVKALSASNVTLTAIEANAAVIELTGTLSAAVSVIVPVSGARQWTVINSCTGNFRVTFRTAAGAGVILPSAGAALVYHDGSNTFTALARRGVLALPSASALVADFARTDAVRVVLTGNSTITLTGASDGQRCVLEVIQDATGGRSLSFGAEVRYGTDLPLIALTSTANVRHRLGFIFSSAAGSYDFVAQARGF